MQRLFKALQLLLRMDDAVAHGLPRNAFQFSDLRKRQILICVLRKQLSLTLREQRAVIIAKLPKFDQPIHAAPPPAVK